MARYSAICKGKRARKLVSFPLMGGGEAACALVPLLGHDDAEILSEARAFAIKKGVADPKEGEPIYELALWVHTLARACVDADSPETTPAPFFDGGAAQILDPDAGLDRDRIALLFQMQRSWQEECAPPQRKLTAAEYMGYVLQHAAAKEGDELPFELWPRDSQRSFIRTTCALAVSALELKSPFGSDSPENETSSSESAKDSEPSKLDS